MRPLSSPALLADRPLRHALVLGGSGFLGTPLVAALGAAGARTTCLVHRHEPSGAPAAVLHGSLETVSWRALEGDLPDVIFHLARIAGSGGWRAALTRARNRLANERLLAWLAGCARPPLVVYVGGTLAYGSHGEEPVTEATPLSPISFARLYHAAERPWLRAMRGNDAPVVVVRPAWVLGSGSWFDAYFRRVMRRERAVPLYGPGDNWMSLVHVDDCAGLLVHAARRAPPMTTFNLASFAPLRQVELAERIARLSSLPVRRVTLDELERRFGRAAREAFAFSARVGTLHQALQAGYAPVHADLDAALAALL